MHPNRAFAWTDEAQMRGFIAQVAFCHLFAVTAEGPMVAHAPVIVTPDGDLRFHLARSNRLSAHLDGAVLLASVSADDVYVSPDWYGRENQVPTWDYVAVESEGVVRRLSPAELEDQVEALSQAHEARLAPKAPWSIAKLDPPVLEAMLRGIVGFELKVTARRGTCKLSQNKTAEDIAGVVRALEALGRRRPADLIRRAVQGGDFDPGQAPTGADA